MLSATQKTVATFGVIIVAAGIEHGVGEILQGNAPLPGLMFPSWPDAAFFRIMSGEPAMSIVPNLLVTGILAVLFSLGYIFWAATFVRRRNGGWVLILLGAGMLLAGGGMVPPVLAALIGVFGNTIHGSLPTGDSEGRRSPAARAWPWIYGASVAAWLLLFPGANILGTFFGVEDPAVVVVLSGLAIVSLAATSVMAYAADHGRPLAIAH
jgi:hypothetical protein